MADSSATTETRCSRWENAYRRYREMESSAPDDEVGRMTRFLLQSAASGKRVLVDRLAGYDSARQSPDGDWMPEVTTGLLAELHRIADLRSSYSSASADFVFDDVYHLAFDRLASWRSAAQPVPSAEECLSLYRGQRCAHWTLGPKIYRHLAKETGRAEELRIRASAACSLGRSIASKLGLSFDAGMAIAQHYSGSKKDGELGVPTWMMDFTRDPWTSLFFATDGAQTGEVGVVWSIMPTEFARHTAGKDNRLGSLQLVVPSDVPRIENQSGVFVVAAHPEIFAQYIPFEWKTRFKQISGLRFDDPFLKITHATIYPSDDPYRAMLSEFESGAVVCACGQRTSCRVPVSLVEDPSDPQIYESALSAWLAVWSTKGGNPSELSEVQVFLPRLAKYHALLQSERYAPRLSVEARSIHRMEAAFEHMTAAHFQGEQVSLYVAVMNAYVEHCAVVFNRAEALVLMEGSNELGITRET